jgi:hypothetical protein
MPSDADIRAVLREHGIPVTDRGKLGPKYHAEYERIQAGQVPPNGDESWAGPDDDGDVITATIPGPAGGADGLAGQAGDDTHGEPVAEARPRVRTKRPGSSWQERIRKATSKDKPKGRAKARPRLPVDRLISRGWGAAARIVAPVSGATSRTLQLQAPVAGMVLEDRVRGTAADTVLQYAARGQEAGETVFALAGPPLIVAAIERAQGMDEPARTLRLAILIPMLEEALGLWCKIAGDKMQEAAVRMAENQAVNEEVQRLIGLIFPQAEVQPDDEMAGAPA